MDCSRHTPHGQHVAELLHIHTQLQRPPALAGLPGAVEVRARGVQGAARGAGRRRGAGELPARGRDATGHEPPFRPQAVWSGLQFAPGAPVLH